MIRKKRLLDLMKDNTGTAFPLIVSVTLCMLFIILGISEYMRLIITASGVKDAVQSAVISTVNDNYNEVYHCVREGYAGGYEPSGESFVASVDYGDIYGRLGYLLGMSENGNYLVKTNNGGEMEFRVSELDVILPNTAIAPSGEGDTYYAVATIRLEVPVRFTGNILPNMSIRLQVKAAYTPKF